VIDDLLSVSIRDSGEKISEDGISLLVYLRLGLGYGLWLSGFVHIGGLFMVAPLLENFARLFYDSMPKMIT
jgi:hypothetical protein